MLIRARNHCVLNRYFQQKMSVESISSSANELCGLKILPQCPPIDNWLNVPIDSPPFKSLVNDVCLSFLFGNSRLVKETIYVQYINLAGKTSRDKILALLEIFWLFSGIFSMKPCCDFPGWIVDPSEPLYLQIISILTFFILPGKNWTWNAPERGR